jgi:hypothetical protein
MHASCGEHFKALYHWGIEQTALDGVTISFEKMNLQQYWVPAARGKPHF